MARAGRVVLGSLGLGLLFVLLNGLHFAGSQGLSSEHAKATTLDPGAAAPSHREPAAAPNADDDVARFIGLLVKLRQNDETVVPQMRELAEQLCRVDDRCDAKDILAYYLAIPPQDRARGAAESAEVNEVWNGGVRERAEAGSVGPDWDRIRDDACAHLREIAGRSLEEPDVFPGATALTWLGFIETDRLQRDVQLTESERAQLLQTTRNDVQRALDALGKCGMVSPKTQPMYLLANLQNEAGQESEAYATFRECLALARRVRQSFWQEKCFDGLFRLARRAGDLRECSELLGELASVRTPDKCWVLASAHAHLLLDQDLGAPAFEFLQANPPLEDSQRREWHFLLVLLPSLRPGDEKFGSGWPWSTSARAGRSVQHNSFLGQNF